MQERLKHGFLEKKGFLAPFSMFYRRCRFVDQATKKSGRRVERCRLGRPVKK